MSKLSVYTNKGTKKKSGISLPKEMQEDVNMRLVAQAIRVYEDKMHPGLSQVKTRGEVTASQRKIYRQKGTGRARHGEISAPIFVGGGKAHGPKGIKRELFMPKKMRSKAYKMATTMKAKDGEIVVVEGLSKIKKTKEAAELINKIIEKEKLNPNSKFLFALSEHNKDVVLYLRNLKNVSTVPFASLNAYNVFYSSVVLIDKEALEKESSGSNKGSKRSTAKKQKANKESERTKKKTKKGKGRSA